MPSTPAEQAQHSLEAMIAVARRLCADDVIEARLCGGGGNNQVYKIRTASSTFALKFYGSVDLDDRDRLGREFDGLRFLGKCGVVDSVPLALAVDRAARCALYEWIDGGPVSGHGPADISCVLQLLSALHQARGVDGAASLPPATESVLRLGDLSAQIESRLERLQTVTAEEPDLADFLTTELQPALKQRLARFLEWDLEMPLPPDDRTLSPSDFGFHNALRRPDRTLCFIDFEYFGWDDPAKLAADFLWHPGMDLSEVEQGQFLEGVKRLFGTDASFLNRLDVCYPLYGIRWILIILNEFLPKLWARRAFSGKGRDWEAAKRGQLRKAAAKLATLRSCREGYFTT